MPLRSDGLRGKLGVICNIEQVFSMLKCLCSRKNFYTLPVSTLRFEDLGVKTEELELAVPNLDDMLEYPEVKEVGPERLGKPSLLLKMGGKDTG